MLLEVTGVGEKHPDFLLLPFSNLTPVIPLAELHKKSIRKGAWEMLFF